MMKAREFLWDVIEFTTGARMTTSYIRIGGVRADLHPDWRASVSTAVRETRRVLKDVSGLLDRNSIFLGRTRGVGVISQEDALSYGWTGPCLRSTGIPYDVRKAQPYLVYDRLSFEVPVGEHGDNYDRYIVRMREMDQSLRIIEQVAVLLPDAPPLPRGSGDRAGRGRSAARAGSGSTGRIRLSPNLEGLGEGASDAALDDGRQASVGVPPKEETYTTMEGLISHFLFFMGGKGIRPPKGEVYFSVEGGNGELGFYIVSDGTDRPYRLHLRAPCFHVVAALEQLIKGRLVADIIPTFGVDEHDRRGAGPMSYAPSAAVLERIDRAVAAYPERSAALLPVLRIVQEESGWVPPAAEAWAADKLGLRTGPRPGGPHVLHHVPPPARGPDRRPGLPEPQLRWPARRSSPPCAGKLGIGAGPRPPRTGAFTLVTVECLGNCDHAPCLQIDGVDRGPVTPETRPRRSSGSSGDDEPGHRPPHSRRRELLAPGRLSTPRRLPGGPQGRDGNGPGRHHGRGPKSRPAGPGRGGLPGRARNGAFVPQGVGGPKYLCVNADEGEPGTFKDRWHPGPRSPPAPRGHGHHRLRRRHPHGGHLRPRRVRAHRRPAPRGGGRGRRRGLPRAGPSSAPASVSRSSSTSAPAPTSAARRRPCSNRSKAAAARRG